jgi:hypothetical protein
MCAPRSQEVRLVCADAYRLGERVAAAERRVVAGDTRAVSVAAKALAKKELQTELRERVFDVREIAPEGGVTSKPVRLDHRAERGVGRGVIARAGARAEPREGKS